MHTKTIQRIVTIQLLALPMALAFSSQADASQRKQIINGREVVVHTSPIPVLLHRLVPPQHGRHVTQKEVASGHVPHARGMAAPARKRP